MQPQNGYTQQPFANNPYAQQPQFQVPVRPRSARAISAAFVVSYILTVLVLLGSIGFGVWAFSSRQDYKNNADKKAAVAADKAKQDEAAAKDAEYAERLKNPYKSYTSPATYGSVSFQYPKTWSALITEGTNTQAPVDGYFFPGYLPGLQADTAFALRVQVLPSSYAATTTKYANLAKQGKVTITPYSLPKMPNVVGVKINGQLTSTVQGIVIYLPLRDKTIAISTQSGDYINDFNNTVLASFTFEP